MKRVELKQGMVLLFNGNKIEWCDGTKIVNGGIYKVDRIMNNRAILKSNRSNATTEYILRLDEIEPFELQLDDLTNIVSVYLQLNKEWFVYDKALFDKARKINKRG